MYPMFKIACLLIRPIFFMTDHTNNHRLRRQNTGDLGREIDCLFFRHTRNIIFRIACCEYCIKSKNNIEYSRCRLITNNPTSSVPKLCRIIRFVGSTEVYILQSLLRSDISITPPKMSKISNRRFKLN